MKKILISLMVSLSTAAFAGDKPLVGDIPAASDRVTLAGAELVIGGKRQQPQSVVFLDSLCPMPHWPDCAEKIEQLNGLYETRGSEQWVAVVKSFYIDRQYVADFAERMKLKLPIVFDQDNSLFQDYKVYGNPYQVWLGRDGSIQYRGDSLKALGQL